jgi:hypothetical protein
VTCSRNRGEAGQLGVRPHPDALDDLAAVRREGRPAGRQPHRRPRRQLALHWLGTLGPDSGLQILARVSRCIGQRFGAALDFPAILAGGDLPSTLDQASRPFAEVARGLLETLGGQYGELAKRLGAALDQNIDTEAPIVARTTVRVVEPSNSPRTALPGGTVTTPTLPPGADTTQPHVWGGVPPRNPNFTGHSELLVELQEQLTRVTTAVTAAVGPDRHQDGPPATPRRRDQSLFSNIAARRRASMLTTVMAR